MNSSVHHRIGIAGLVLGPLLFSVADVLRRLVEPSSSASDTVIVAAVHDRPALWLTAGLLSLASAFAFVPGIVTVMGRAHGRGARLTTIGGYLFGAGMLASIGHMSEYFGYFGALDAADVSTATVRRLGSASYPPSAVLIVIFLVGMFLGLLLLVVGLRRSGAVPVWAVVTALVAIVVGSTGGVAAGLVGVVAWLATFFAIVRSLSATEPARVVV